MRVAHIQLYRYDIPFIRPFVTSKFTLENRTGLILTAETANGAIGLGEIAPLPGFSHETIDDCVAAARDMIWAIRDYDIPDSPALLRKWSDEHFGAPPSVVFGFETLLADLAAQAANMNLAQWYRTNASSRVAINAVIAGAIVETSIRQKCEQGYRTIKLKVGSLPVADDVERVATVKEMAGPEVRVRLDANRAYDLAEAESLMSAIESYDIEYIEEPLRNADAKGLARLRRKSIIPIAIDETLVEMYNARTSTATAILATPAELDLCDVVIIKPSLMGGIDSTIEFCQRLIHGGKRIVVTSALDTGIGVAAALHIACALRIPDACGLDTAGTLANEVLDSPFTPFDGHLALPNQPGLGVRLSNDPVVRRCLTELHVD